MENSLRDHVREIIFEADTPGGKLFDVVLIAAIAMSVFVVLLDSVGSVRDDYGSLFYRIEWFFTILFTIEYALRLYSIQKPAKYALSFFGVIDLLAILPTYLSLFVAGSHYIVVIRVLRVLRVFRILKLVQYVTEANVLLQAMRASQRKITVFLFSIVSLVIILGAFMYLIESDESGFTSIPRSMYWAVVTLTTVGYGDISPQTTAGQALASFIMILGYSIIAVPTGIVTAELTHMRREDITTRVCPTCSAEGHDPDAVYCKRCGAPLAPNQTTPTP